MKPKVKLIHYSDWVKVYLNDTLVDEGHSLNFWMVYDLLVKLEVEVEQEWIEGTEDET